MEEMNLQQHRPLLERIFHFNMIPYGILGDIDIEKQNLISPFNKENLNPASCDLTLNNTFLILKSETGKINPLDKTTYSYDKIVVDESITLHPGEFVLGSTNEIIDLMDSETFIVGEVEGKSSLARLGLEIHLTAGFIDPGFRGTITLELLNNTKFNLTLTKNMRICQIVFHRVSDVKEMYHKKKNSKYTNQLATMGSLY